MVQITQNKFNTKVRLASSNDKKEHIRSLCKEKPRSKCGEEFIRELHKYLQAFARTYMKQCYSYRKQR